MVKSYSTFTQNPISLVTRAYKYYNDHDNSDSFNADRHSTKQTCNPALIDFAQTKIMMTLDEGKEQRAASDDTRSFPQSIDDTASFPQSIDDDEDDHSSESYDHLAFLRDSNDRSLDEGPRSFDSVPSTIESDVPSNVALLNIAFVSFLGFTILQTFAAVLARSEAMMGDSASMGVDAMTYAFNLYAEKRKDTADKKTKLLLELIPPAISVVVLLVVTFFLFRKAIITLAMGVPENPADEPNVAIMFIFSSSNLLLDGLNIFCFARAKHATGYNTGVEDANLDPQSSITESEEGQRLKGDLNNDSSSFGAKMEDEEETNLNMCSAYTHVFADTLRSIAVIIASSIAETVDSIDPEEADATAAIVVSVIIFFSLIPLVQGIVHTWSELKTERKRIVLSSTLEITEIVQV